MTVWVPQRELCGLFYIVLMRFQLACAGGLCYTRSAYREGGYRMKPKSTIHLTTSQFILLGFLLVILSGSVLLVLPISAADGQSVPYIDALFTATTATCVTGLVTLPTVSTWSAFGQAVILLLIQIGGLGVVTIISWMMLLFHRRIGISTRLLIQDAFNLNTLSGLVRFVKKVLLGTLIVEGAGALAYMTVFVPQFGARGIWISIFNSVSAFCNAGIDIISENSLCAYARDPLINIVTCLLIVLGGIGYIVWWDVVRVLGLKRRGTPLRLWKRLTLQSKLAIFMTLLLIFGGAALLLIFEGNNPLTLGGMSTGEKLQAAIFQSVTTRTAGFATVPQQALTDGGAIISLLLMFIGGSPAGTAGGIKTVTAAVLAATAFSVIKGRDNVNLYHRHISEQVIHKAAAVAAISFATAFFSTVALAAVVDAPAIDIMFETVSATATVGLSRNLTPMLNGAGKLIITATMYFGRVGPISLAFALSGRGKSTNMIKNPTEDLSVG